MATGERVGKDTGADVSGRTVTASGSTTARTLAARFADVVNVRDFGAVGDGVADDTAAIQAALSAGKRRVEFPDGTYRVTSGLTVSADVELWGPAATLRFDFVGTGITVAAGKRFEAHGLAFDGRGKAKVLVDLTTPPSFAFEQCAFSNVYGATGAVRALSIASPTSGRISDCSFTHLYMLGNGSEGDTDGAVRAVYLSTFSGEPKDVRIVGNRFTDIHSVTTGTTDSFGNPATPIMEDADAVHIASTTGYQDAYVLIQANHFENVGKRAVKYQANRGTIRDNWIVSSWADSSDPVNPNMMFAAIEAFGGNCVISGNRVLGTYYQHGIAVGDASVTQLGTIIENNEIVPTGTVFDSAIQTVKYGTRNGILATRQHDLRVSGNRVVAWVGFRSAFRTTTLAQKVAVVGNVFTNNFFGVDIEGGAVTGMTVSGNVIVGRDPGSVVGVYVVGSSDQVSVTGNSIANVQDGIKFDAPAPVVATVAGNSFASVRGAHLLGWPGDVAGAGSPEAAVAAPPGSTYRRTDGGAGTCLYVKETGTGNTGWVAK